MLLLPPSSCPAAEWDVDMRQYAVYIGATTNPIARLRSHARPSSMVKGFKAALLKRQQSADGLFWLPSAPLLLVVQPITRRLGALCELSKLAAIC